MTLFSHIYHPSFLSTVCLDGDYVLYANLDNEVGGVDANPTNLYVDVCANGDNRVYVGEVISSFVSPCLSIPIHVVYSFTFLYILI